MKYYTIIALLFIASCDKAEDKPEKEKIFTTIEAEEWSGQYGYFYHGIHVPGLDQDMIDNGDITAYYKEHDRWRQMPFRDPDVEVKAIFQRKPCCNAAVYMIYKDKSVSEENLPYSSQFKITYKP